MRKCLTPSVPELQGQLGSIQRNCCLIVDYHLITSVKLFILPNHREISGNEKNVFLGWVRLDLITLIMIVQNCLYGAVMVSVIFAVYYLLRPYVNQFFTLVFLAY